MSHQQTDTSIQYSHAIASHTVAGAMPVLADLVATYQPRSLIDIGCGNGSWLRAALELGISDVHGLDGIVLPQSELLVPTAYIEKTDFTSAWSISEKADLAICLEVAEHLEAGHAETFIQQVISTSDRILFSGAIPDQPGQHHVNCQWPEYWQAKFNQCGFVCEDSIRWRHWENSLIEPWYRQNMFVATRDPTAAGSEVRLRAVIHPELGSSSIVHSESELFAALKEGRFPMQWHMKVMILALLSKLLRKSGLAKKPVATTSRN